MLRVRMPTGGTRPSVTAPWSHAEAAVGCGLPFLLVVYLALSGGGYDPIVYGEVGVICWWAVLLGVLVGVLPLLRIGRAAWVALGLLAALAVWTAIGISWSGSAERSVAELGRVAALLGVYAVAIAVRGRAAVRRTVYGVAAAIGSVSVLALLSRFHPELFPPVQAARYLDDVQARLGYPLDYWNALAAFVAVGIPLVLCVASTARTRAVRAAAAAVLPAMALTAYFTVSRGAVVEIGAALVAFLAFFPRRLHALGTIVVAGGASAILIGIATGKGALGDGLDNSTAISQGNEMLVLTIALGGLVALAQLTLASAEERGVAPPPRPPRRAVLTAVGLLAALVIVGGVAAGAPGKLSDKLHTFTKAEGPDPNAGTSRYASLSGNGRYQLWKQAVEANATDPLTGIGPGTFEYWWTRHRPIDAYARSAHSLYLNELAELGMVGLLIVLGVVFWPVAAGIGRWRSDRPRRDVLAGALAAAVAFAVSAAIDRVWDFAALIVVFLLVAAALVAGDGGDEPEQAVHAPLRMAGRLSVAAAALAAAAVVAIPTVALMSIRQSQADVNSGDAAAALDSAAQAGTLEPYAATPDLQRAFILELDGDLADAAATARDATGKEADNWRTWLVLARIEAERGRTGAALKGFRRARTLNPLSDSLNE